MTRRQIAGAAVALVVVASSLGWFAGSRIKSPGEVAARTDAPPASPILVPAEQRSLSTDIITRGTARFGTPQQVNIAASALKPDPGVVTLLPEVGADLAEGSVVLSASGRPLLLLEGATPVYRDLGPGLEGDDVRQLEAALNRMGFDPGPIDGTYDQSTEAGVAAWYAAAGFSPFEATTDQLAAIRALEQELSSVRLESLGANTSVASARADVTAADIAHRTSRTTAQTAFEAIAVAEADAVAANDSVALDITSQQALLDALTTGTPGSPAEIATAQTEFDLAVENVETVRLTGQQAVRAAQDDLDAAGGDLALAQADASSALGAAELDATNKQAALDALVADPTATPADLAAAQTELDLAVENIETVRLTGQQAVQAAQDALDAAPGDLALAQADASSALGAAELDATNKQAALDALVTGSPGSPADIAAAQRDLAATRLAVEPTRLAGEQTVAAAVRDHEAADGDVVVAAAALEVARTSLANAQAGQDTQGGPVSQIELDLGLARRRAGVQLPADEIVFLPSVPVRVADIAVAAGDASSGVIMTVTDSQVAIDASLSLDEATLIEVGTPVQIDEPELGITATGLIGRIAETPGTDGVDAFHVYVEIIVDDAPVGLVGVSARVIIPIESTGGEVLAVPIPALSLAPDGSSRVQRDNKGTLEFVTVEPGLSADGFVSVTPTSGTLDVGDLVVIGFEQSAPGPDG